MGPLAGIKVIEMAGMGPVPLCGMMMADMGAELYLIERKTGASAESTLHVSKRDMMKRGKQTIALDLKDPAAIDYCCRWWPRRCAARGFPPRRHGAPRAGPRSLPGSAIRPWFTGA